MTVLDNRATADTTVLDNRATADTTVLDNRATAAPINQAINSVFS